MRLQRGDGVAYLGRLGVSLRRHRPHGQFGQRQFRVQSQQAAGGHGFGHLTGAVVPWMHQRGFTPAETDLILVDNPTRLLAVTPA